MDSIVAISEFIVKYGALIILGTVSINIIIDMIFGISIISFFMNKIIKKYDNYNE